MISFLTFLSSLPVSPPTPPNRPRPPSLRACPPSSSPPRHPRAAVVVAHMYVTGPRRDGVTSGRAVSNFLPGPRGHRTAFPPQASDQGSTPPSHPADSQHAVVRPTVVYSRPYAQRTSYPSGPWGERLTEKEEKKRKDKKKRTTLPLHLHLTPSGQAKSGTGERCSAGMAAIRPQISVCRSWPTICEAEWLISLFFSPSHVSTM